MVHPSAVHRIVLDAARLVKTGEIVVFGSASLAFWLQDAHTSRDVDIWVTPAERGDAVQAGPRTWRERALKVSLPEAPGVDVIVPHPHDVLISKLERFEPQDRDHVRRILAEAPLDRGRLDVLAADSPYRTGEAPKANIEAFERHLAEFRASLRG